MRRASRPGRISPRPSAGAGKMSFLDERDMASATYAESWERPEAMAKSAGGAGRVEKSVRLLKSDEERYVLGVVLEPTLELNKPDSQGDVYSAEDVRQAAYNFMQKSQTIGIQHKSTAGDKIKILESWIQRDDTTIDGQKIYAGTWLMGVRIVDDDLWAAVKDGSFTGFSIGGVAQRTPVGAS